MQTVCLIKKGGTALAINTWSVASPGNAVQRMTRKDNEKDSERPHYYSQFWLDVAAGRRVIGAPKPNDESDQGDIELPEPVSSHRDGRMSSEPEESFTMPAATNGYSETIEHPVAEPIVEDEEVIEPESDDLIIDDDLDTQEDDLEDTDIPDMDLSPLSDEEEDFYEEEESDEDEEDDGLGWSGRGRKRTKPTRATKQPTRKPKREPRRGY